MIGIFSKTIDSNLIDALAYSGMDFVILDQEHGPVSNYTLHNHVRAAKLGGLKSIVRVKGVDSNAIGSALDSGADGVQIPNISTAQEAKKAIDAARFFPSGNRGVCRFVKAADYGCMPKENYFDNANQKLVILQVEGKRGINNIDEILDIEGFDILFIGPYDLSQSLGIPGQITHPEIERVIKEVSQKAIAKGKKLGTFSDTISNARNLMQLGFEYMAYSVDLNIYMEATRNIKNQILNQ